MVIQKALFRFLYSLLTIILVHSPVIHAGTIYLYLENKTDQPLIIEHLRLHWSHKPRTTTIKPHTREEIGFIEGTPAPCESCISSEQEPATGGTLWRKGTGGNDSIAIDLILPRFSKTIYLKAASASSLKPVKRIGLNWDISYNDTLLQAGTSEDVPGSKREFFVTQDKNCNSSCKKYKITAAKQTYLIRAPDINFIIEEV